MSSPTAVSFVALESTDVQRWDAWVERGKVHDELVTERLRVVAASLVCAVSGGLLVALEFGR